MSALKGSAFWIIKPCSPLKENQRFGGTCHLHLQVQKLTKQETSMKVSGK
jgi:hypothetical protein